MGKKDHPLQNNFSLCLLYCISIFLLTKMLTYFIKSFKKKHVLPFSNFMERFDMGLLIFPLFVGIIELTTLLSPTKISKNIILFGFHMQNINDFC